jgi:hypothetical protein
MWLRLPPLRLPPLRATRYRFTHPLICPLIRH